MMIMELNLASWHEFIKVWIFFQIFSFTQSALAQGPPMPPSTADTNPHSKSPVGFVGLMVLGLGAFLFFGCVIPLCIFRNGFARANTSTTTAIAAFDRTDTASDAASGANGCGVDENVVEAFPLINYAAVKHMRASKSPLECAICLSEFLDDDTLRLLPGCRHVYHVDCIAAWLAQHKTCPVCRSDLSDPKVIAGKRLLSLNIESKDVAAAGSSHLPEHTDNVHQKLKEPRHVQSMTGWERFTLILPDDVMKDIKTTHKYRKAVSLQDHTKQRSTGTGARDWRIQSFLNTLSWNRQQKLETKVAAAAPDNNRSDASDSADTSGRRLLAFSTRSEKEMLQIDSSWTQIELHNLPADQRV